MNDELYADGGVILDNPSPFGGTWAFLVVRDGQVLEKKSGAISPKGMSLGEAMESAPLVRPRLFSKVTNNQTEMLALIHGLQALPATWCGTVYSDSKVSLFRIFGDMPWNNVPEWLRHAYETERQRLCRFAEFEYVLLDGHPNREQLAAGFGKRGHPVSIHNVWCDKACKIAGREFMKARKK